MVMNIMFDVLVYKDEVLSWVTFSKGASPSRCLMKKLIAVTTYLSHAFKGVDEEPTKDHDHAFVW